jgi:uncharacterized tellurite resistance protein B-like protein
MMGFLDLLLGRDASAAAPGGPPAYDEQHLAAAALMIEAAVADGSCGPKERLQIRQLLEARFGLDSETARDLLDHAAARSAEGSDWHGYTRVLKDAYDEAGRIAMVEMLWEIVLADGTVHDYEASLMRRVPALLYVSDRANAAARARAAERLATSAKPRPWGP